MYQTKELYKNSYKDILETYYINMKNIYRRIYNNKKVNNL